MESNSMWADRDGRTYAAPRAQTEAFSVDVRPDRHRVFVVPQGELDVDTIDAVAAEVEALVEFGFDAIVIDLRAVTFIDSSGVHLLLKYARRADVDITVVDGPPAVSRVFDLTGARDVLSFETTTG